MLRNQSRASNHNTQAPFVNRSLLQTTNDAARRIQRETLTRSISEVNCITLLKRIALWPRKGCPGLVDQLIFVCWLRDLFQFLNPSNKANTAADKTARHERIIKNRIDRIELIWHREHVHALPARTTTAAAKKMVARLRRPKFRTEMAESLAGKVF